MNIHFRKGIERLSPWFLILPVLLPLSLFLASCDALKPDQGPALKAIPGGDYRVLDTGSPAVLLFAEDVEPASVEALARIRCGDDGLSLSRRWSGRRLELHPLDRVIPGLEYRLELDGFYLNSDGREREASLSRPFYWGCDSVCPLSITGSLPENGAIIGREDALYISFSSLPEAASLSRNMDISPSVELIREWNGSTLIIRPEETWNNLSSYRLELDGELQDKSGNSLIDNWSLSFYVEEGVTPPRVVQSAACGRDRSADCPWIIPSAPSPSYSQGLRLSFSRLMDRDKTESAFSLSPSLAGDLYWIETAAAADMAFIPDEGFDMGTLYTLTLAESAQSESGLEMEEDFIREFTPLIPILSLESLECLSSGGFTLNEYTDISPQDLPVKTPSPYDLLFRLSFSRPFPTEEEKQGVQEGISLYEIFSGGGSPRPGLYAWESDTLLTVLYSGFQADQLSEYYYLLELTGAAGGIRNREGGYLKEDVSQLLRVPKQ